MKKAVIFDMDGIIFNTEKNAMIGYLKAYEIANIAFTKSDFIKYIGQTSKMDFEDIMRRTNYDRKLSESIFENAVQIQKKLQKDNLETMPHIRELLDFFKEKNFSIHIASSSHKNTILANLERSGLRHYFEQIVAGNEIEKSKPEPDIYLKALELAKINADEAFVIEDSKAGVLSAYNACIDVIMVPDLVQVDEEIRSKAFAIAKNHLEVIEIIKEKLK